MSKQTLYTAVGHFRQKKGDGGRYPVIIVNQKEYMADIQEMTIWTCLNWRILDLEQLRETYRQTLGKLVDQQSRPFDECVRRLVTRGLVMEGTGETGYDALYDLLGSLYVVPISTSPFLRLWAFFKLTLLSRVPASKAKRLFKRDHPTADEARVMRLSKQALMSTAELIKCVETGTFDVSTDDKLLDALYDDEDTTDLNIPYLMRNTPSAQPVTAAVANLYLRQQIIFQRH